MQCVAHRAGSNRITGSGFTDVVVEGAGEYPVTVSLRRLGDPVDTSVTVRAKYVVGCDGARSVVRQSIGRELVGDTANHAWGVMDILAVTDFPDIRLKAVVQSESGNLFVIPREGGYLVRLYVDLGQLHPDNRVAVRDVSSVDVVAIAQRVFHPYALEVKETAWFSIYEVGQRVCEKFDDLPLDHAGAGTPRVLIAGDACHTHSAKAGQGMNVSMQDAFNLGWKLAAVLEGRSPESLLHTYSAERQAIAQELIDFDKEWSAIVAAPPQGPGEPVSRRRRPAELQDTSYSRVGSQPGRHPLHALAADRPSDTSGPGSGVHNRHAVSLGVGDTTCRRQARATWTCRTGGWPLAAVCLRRSGRSRRSNVTSARPLRTLRTRGRLAGPAIHTDATDIDGVFDVRAVLQQYHRDFRARRTCHRYCCRGRVATA